MASVVLVPAAASTGTRDGVAGGGAAATTGGSDEAGSDEAGTATAALTAILFDVLALLPEPVDTTRQSPNPPAVVTAGKNKR